MWFSPLSNVNSSFWLLKIYRPSLLKNHIKYKKKQSLKQVPVVCKYKWYLICTIRKKHPMFHISRLCMKSICYTPLNTHTFWRNIILKRKICSFSYVVCVCVWMRVFTWRAGFVKKCCIYRARIGQNIKWHIYHKSISKFNE